MNQEFITAVRENDTTAISIFLEGYPLTIDIDSCKKAFEVAAALEHVNIMEMIFNRIPNSQKLGFLLSCNALGKSVSSQKLKVTEKLLELAKAIKKLGEFLAFENYKAFTCCQNIEAFQLICNYAKEAHVYAVMFKRGSPLLFFRSISEGRLELAQDIVRCGKNKNIKMKEELLSYKDFLAFNDNIRKSTKDNNSLATLKFILQFAKDNNLIWEMLASTFKPGILEGEYFCLVRAAQGVCLDDENSIKKITLIWDIAPPEMRSLMLSKNQFQSLQYTIDNEDRLILVNKKILELARSINMDQTILKAKKYEAFLYLARKKYINCLALLLAFAKEDVAQAAVEAIINDKNEQGHEPISAGTKDLLRSYHDLRSKLRQDIERLREGLDSEKLTKEQGLPQHQNEHGKESLLSQNSLKFLLWETPEVETDSNKKESDVEQLSTDKENRGTKRRLEPVEIDRELCLRSKSSIS